MRGMGEGRRGMDTRSKMNTVFSHKGEDGLPQKEQKQQARLATGKNHFRSMVEIAHSI